MISKTLMSLVISGVITSAYAGGNLADELTGKVSATSDDKAVLVKYHDGVAHRDTYVNVDKRNILRDDMKFVVNLADEAKRNVNPADISFGIVKHDGQNAVKFDIRNLHFATDEYTLSDEDKLRLEQVAKTLRGKQVSILIIGHTDDRGTVEYNKKLSEKRAKAVAEYLHKSGIPMQYMKTEGHGEMNPVAINSTPEGRSENRRVEIYVTGLSSNK